jgi:Subtilase family/PilZ domain
MVRIFFKVSIYLLLFLSFASYAHGQTQSAATTKNSTSKTSHRYIEGEIIIKMKTSANPGFQGRGAMSAKASSFISRVRQQNGMQLKNAFSEMNLYHFKLAAGKKVLDAMNDFKNDADVQYAEPNYLYSKANVPMATQSYTAQQVAAMSSGGGSNSASSTTTYAATSAPIQVANSWGTVTAHTVPIVAVVDTGLDTTHPVFVGTNAVWTNPGEIPANQIDDDRNGYVDDVTGYNFVANSGSMYDDDGHGTHCSGIILGVTQNIYAGTYEPSLIKIMPLKFLDSTGYGQTADAIRAIDYAVSNGASVISNSWGGPDYSAALQEAVAFAYSSGVVFVAAAGNNAENNNVASMYPANLPVPNVISVAATTDTDDLAYFSDYGSASVPLAAPGLLILSTIPGGGFETMSGTSMATPFVSGLAAMIKAQQPSILAYQIKQLIMSYADVPTDGNGVPLLQGKTITQGRINVYNTEQASKTVSVLSTQPEYTVTNIDTQLSSSIAATGCGLVKKMISDGKDNGIGGEGAPESWSVLVVIGLMALPMLIYNSLRRKSKDQRKHERFKIDTQVKVQFGDRELVGSISCISLGGVQLNTDALIDQGSIVSMAIRSPDGSAQVEVEGRIVWSEKQKAYGVQFAETTANVREQINAWTTGLQKVPVRK